MDAKALGRSLQALRAKAPVEALVVNSLPDAPDLKEILEAMAQERAKEYAETAKKGGGR
jgi:hypothetical protein